MRHYAKPHSSPEQRVAHLRSKGLIIGKPRTAAHKIETVGYERLRIYFLSRRDAPGKQFRPGTTFKHILQLYECDSRLREISFREVCRFEIVFRNAMSEALSSNFGSHPYYDRDAFRDAASHNKALAQVIQTFDKHQDERAKHYKKNYSSPALPPIWTLKEFLTFGAAARIFECLSGHLRAAIAKKLGVPKLEVFENWLKCFVDLRNACAHHDRIFNRKFQKQLQRLPREGIPVGGTASLRGLLECLDFIMRQLGEKSGAEQEAGRLLKLRSYSAVDPSEVGF